MDNKKVRIPTRGTKQKLWLSLGVAMTLSLELPVGTTDLAADLETSYLAGRASYCYLGCGWDFWLELVHTLREQLDRLQGDSDGTSCWHLAFLQLWKKGPFLAFKVTLSVGYRTSRRCLLGVIIVLVVKKVARTYKTLGNEFGDPYPKSERLWQEFFTCPSEWWDNRAKKLSLKSPDFKNKSTGEALWINSTFTPKWVEAQLELYDAKNRTAKADYMDSSWTKVFDKKAAYVSSEGDEFSVI